jgi:hypothetical protein
MVISVDNSLKQTLTRKKWGGHKTQKIEMKWHVLCENKSHWNGWKMNESKKIRIYYGQMYIPGT